MKDNLSFYEESADASPVSIVSIPIELGSDERGLAAAPNYLFKSGIEQMFASIRRTISSKETIACPKPPSVASAGVMKHVKEIAAVAKSSAAAVEKAARAGNTVVALGGDHSMAIGSLAGAAAAHESLGVIYIDAHPDCNTDKTTLTGNLHGMVTAALMGEGHDILTSIPKRFIAPENFLFLGIKDFDQAEIEFLRRKSVPSVTMLEIATCGLSLAIAAIEGLRKKVDKIWISMDMDSIDLQYSPAVGLPARDGFTRREVLALAHYIGKTCDVAGLDIVEILPVRDVEGKTAALAIELAARFLGGEYSWYQQQYIGTYRETNVTKVNKKAVPARKSRKQLYFRNVGAEG